jgi:hypothetical protein
MKGHARVAAAQGAACIHRKAKPEASMPTARSFPAILATSVALGLAAAAPAQAQLARTFVSSAGSDANDCNRLTPCRTFQRAHDNTLANGEITVLDPGGYGAVTITKSIGIINDGVGEAGVLVSGGAVGVTVHAAASDSVSLRGLTIKGIGFGGGNGIRFRAGKSLTVENCAIRNLTSPTDQGHGILFEALAPGGLAVSNTVIADNDANGILIDPAGSGVVTATLKRVELYNNGIHGLAVSPLANTVKTNVTVVDSVAAGNVSRGFSLSVPPNGTTFSTLMVIGSVAANNGTGLVADGETATFQIGQSTVAGNNVTWLMLSNGIRNNLLSFGDNYIAGNADNDPDIATFPKK